MYEFVFGKSACKLASILITVNQSVESVNPVLIFMGIT